MKRFGLSTLFLALVFTAACAGDGPREWVGEVVDSAGIPVVMNPAEGLWGPEEGWTLEEELSIGTASGDPSEQFGAIVGMDVDASGNVYIADQLEAEVRVFDAAGTYLRTMGGRGSGPGEIGQAGGLIVSGEEVLVPDLANQRVNVYSLDGEPGRGFPLDLSQGLPVRWDEGLDGQLLVQLRPLAMDPTAEIGGDRVVVVGQDGSLERTIMELPAGESFQIVGGRQQRKFLGTEPIWDAGDDGTIVWGKNTEYRMELRDPTGQLTSVVAREFEQKPFTERDQEVFIGALEDAIARQGAPPQAAAAFFANVSFAEFYPTFVILLAGPDGSLWVQRIRSGNELVGEEAVEFDPADLGSNEWEVFDGEGRYLGVVEFPPRFQPFRTLGDRFYGVARDDFDVQSLKVFRVVR